MRSVDTRNARAHQLLAQGINLLLKGDHADHGNGVFIHGDEHFASVPLTGLIHGRDLEQEHSSAPARQGHGVDLNGRICIRCQPVGIHPFVAAGAECWFTLSTRPRERERIETLRALRDFVVVFVVRGRGVQREVGRLRHGALRSSRKRGNDTA